MNNHRFDGDCRTAPDSVCALYDGWLDVERSTVQSMDKYVTQSMLSFPSGWVEMRQFRWSQPLESIYTTTSRCCMVNLTLSGWIRGGSTQSLQTNRWREAEAIGRMRLIPPNQSLKVHAIEGQARSIRCVLDAALFESVLADEPQWEGTDDLLRAAHHVNGGQIEWLLRRMYRELRSPDFATPQVIEALAKQLTVEIIRVLKLHRDETAHHVGGLAPWRLRLIRKRLLSEEPLPSLEDLANLCDMTERHLSRAFRSETGATLGRHIEAAMVERANRMLANGTPVREIAAAFGYAAPCSFSAAFRRATGMLPSEVSAAAKIHGTARKPPVHAVTPARDVNARFPSR
jgi:AraC family transcriptional regulator